MSLIDANGRRVPRTVTLLLLVTATASLLAACGDDDSPEARASDRGDVGHEDASPPVEGARQVRVTARSLAFDPDEITVAAGEDVAIVLTSEDSLHDFTIDEFDGHVGAEAGETSTGGFSAGKAGRYTYYCSVPGHREAGMEGVLVVEA